MPLLLLLPSLPPQPESPPWGLRGEGWRWEGAPAPWPGRPPAQAPKERDTPSWHPHAAPTGRRGKELTTQPAERLLPKRAGGRQARTSRGVMGGSTPGKRVLGRRNLQTSVYQNEARKTFNSRRLKGDSCGGSASPPPLHPPVQHTQASAPLPRCSRPRPALSFCQGFQELSLI